MTDEAVSPNDIAIVGLAAHLPGARNTDEFWRNLRDGVESVRRFTDEELLASGVSAETLRNPNYVKAGVVLDDMELFDAEFFGFSPKEAGIMDPQHRHFLECAWEALENAGHMPERFAGRIGVYAGCGMGSYFIYNLLSNPELVKSVGLFLLRHTGNDKDFLATRVSYCFNLKGPSINVQTACSTSLVAIHTACQNLLSGECDLALAGGSTIDLPHRRGYLFQKGEILSPDGHCHAFDHRAQGTLFGSGAGVVVLRRLEDALADGDHIHAVIKGSAVNNDGAGKVGYFAPSVDGQAAAIAEALAVANVSADSVNYVECHGTGTAMGDPIEVAALTQAFRQSTARKGFCGLGSVKTNIGHLDTAAGVASVIKTALALEHKQLPPTLNYEAPNPTIDFASSPFRVNDRLQDWARGSAPRRAAVNSLGVGGTNAHAILEEAPAVVPSSPATRPYQLLTLSARNKGALDEAGRRLAAHLREHPEQNLADVAYTLHVGRQGFDQRRVVAARDHAEAIRLLESGDSQRVFTHRVAQDKPSIVFMFPGGGAQYLRMGADLYATEPVFREHVDRGLAALQGKVEFDLRAVWFAEGERAAAAEREFQRPAVQLPAIFILEYALAKLWMSWGVQPAALIGHSLGENTAACVAGVLSFEDALGLVTLRGRLFERVPEGGMVSVPLSAEALQPLLGDDLDLATINGPEFCTVSGPVAALERLERLLVEREIDAKRVPISIAAHSRMLTPILDDFRAYLRSIKLTKPTIPFVSNRTGTWITDREATDPDYWVDHLRHTIRFADGLSTLVQTPGRLFLEVGPGKILSSLVRQHPGVQASQSVLASVRHPKEETNDAAFFLTTLGRLWASGVEFKADQLWRGERRRRVPLPTYAFQRQRYWIEPGQPALAHAEETPSLEKLKNFDEWYYQPVWNERKLNAAAEAEPGAWLVFLDEAGVGQRLVERLRQAGHDVVTVREADAYHQHNANEYSLAPEHGRDGYDALLRDLVAGGKSPRHVLHLWMLTADERFRPGSSFFHRNQERGFYSLLFLAQAIGGSGIVGPLHITVASNGMQQVGEERLAHPDKATLLGPVKVIPRELPGVTCSSVDIDLPQATRGLFGKRNRPVVEAAVESLLAEALAPAGNAIVAVRQGRRYEQSYERGSDSRSESATNRLRTRGTYLITGGLGGIGQTVAEHLARTVQARLVLVGRTGLPERGEWDTWLRTHAADDAVSRRIRQVRKLESLGGEVLVAAADVTDVEAMRQVMVAARQRFGAIHGVIHAAGTLRDNLIPLKTQSEVEDVFTPKVHGTLVLDGLLRDEPLDFFVVFASTSTVTAPAGQVDYVAANAFLNAYAASRNTDHRDTGRYTVAINWGIWNEVGMAADAAARMLAGPEAAPSGEPARHPLFDRRTGGAHAQQTILTARYSPASHWILDEHRTAAGHALLPGTGYLELARAALAEIGVESPFAIHDLFFLRPLHVADDESKEIRVILERSDEGFTFAVQGRVALDDGRTGWETHATARLTVDGRAKPRAVELRGLAARCGRQQVASDDSGLKTRQEEHLRFGPRWRVLREVSYGEGEALARLELPARFTGDLAEFGLHPALLDLATGFAMSLIRGYEQSNALWVPVSYKQVRVHGRLPQRIVSHVRNHGDNRADGEFAIFDIVLADESGRVLVEVDEFAIKRMTGDVDFAVAAKPKLAELQLDAPRNNEGDRQLSPAELAFQHNLSQGILPAEGAAALERVLSTGGAAQVIVSSLDLSALVRQAEQTTVETKSDGTKFERPQLDSEYVEPRDDIERTLVGIWEELLGVDRIGIRDGFFELGGHSLIAVRLFARIKKTWQVEYPISVLFQAPTIESCAALIRETVGTSDAERPAVESHRPRYTHLVAMHEGNGGSKTPFFLVAGMFGNVLNLRRLAQVIGADRPCYGLQARGLYGDHNPHETFEEMAADYLRELRTVQPHGPYLLGGFSGGGITAYEMARQLRADGEEVAFLTLLDTPLPFSPSSLTLRDKLVMHLDRLKKQKLGYFTSLVRERFSWELEQWRKRRAGPAEAKGPAEFQSEAIEQAFRRALDRYSLEAMPGALTLFRPKLKPLAVLGPGRMINADRRFIFHDNGWTPYADRVEVQEVPGDHDSMVLEPNVRVLGARLRQAIADAESLASRCGRETSSPAPVVLGSIGLDTNLVTLNSGSLA